ncbi:odorant receptor 67d-like [Culicoides brevitarsis]|uniref:odorant receptor 67d-like n=1 Tax=Culicoides brevitarsis TaxID=469753 RepID=UPI00307B6B62
MNSAEKYRNLIFFLNDKIAFVCGCNLMTPDFKYNARTFVLHLSLATLYISSAYTIHYFWTEREFFKILEVVAVFGFAVQGTAKMQLALKNRESMTKQAYFLIDIHEKYQKHPGRRRALEQCIDRSIFMFKIMAVIYSTAVLFVLIYPVLYYIVFKEKVTFLTLIVPGIDHRANYGFLVNTFYQVYLLAAAVNGLLVYDGYFMILSVHYSAFVDMFRINLVELGLVLSKQLLNSKRKVVETKLREVLVEHQVCMNFMNHQNECFATACTFQAWSSTWSIVFSLFVNTRGIWLAGFAMLLVGFCQLGQYCIIGTIIDIKNDEALLAIYEVPFHMMSKKEKQDLEFMLHKAQNPNKLYIGGILPLNVETMTEILRSIYEGFTMLLSYV